MPASIRTENLSKSFGSRIVLDNLSFELPFESFLSIFGPNGAGKTTLLRILATLLALTSGDIRIDGMDVKDQPETIRGSIGFLSHSPMMYPDLTAEENLLLFARLYGVSDAHDKVDELLDAVGLHHRRRDTLRMFSTGMLQRISIARTLIHDPRIVLLDEPYSGLDLKALDIFDGLIDRYRRGRTFVMASHDMEKGLSISTHVLMIDAGKQVLFEERTSLTAATLRELFSSQTGYGVI